VSPATYKILDGVADSFNPLLALLALIVPVRKPRVLRESLRYYLAAGLALGFVYLLRAIDAHEQLWAAAGLDYSTHSAFAAALAVSMGTFKRRWAALLALAVLLYFSLELIMRYHSLLDILTSATLAGGAALLFERATAHWTSSAVGGSGPIRWR
jgi:hypothetical protein